MEDETTARQIHTDSRQRKPPAYNARDSRCPQMDIMKFSRTSFSRTDHPG